MDTRKAGVRDADVNGDEDEMTMEGFTY